MYEALHVWVGDPTCPVNWSSSVDRLSELVETSNRQTTVFKYRFEAKLSRGCCDIFLSICGYWGPPSICRLAVASKTSYSSKCHQWSPRPVMYWSPNCLCVTHTLGHLITSSLCMVPAHTILFQEETHWTWLWSRMFAPYVHDLLVSIWSVTLGHHVWMWDTI